MRFTGFSLYHLVDHASFTALIGSDCVGKNNLSCMYIKVVHIIIS